MVIMTTGNCTYMTSNSVYHIYSSCLSLALTLYSYNHNTSCMADRWGAEFNKLNITYTLLLYLVYRCRALPTWSPACWLAWLLPSPMPLPVPHTPARTPAPRGAGSRGTVTAGSSPETPGRHGERALQQQGSTGERKKEGRTCV
jgi:hypothetical protein